MQGQVDVGQQQAFAAAQGEIAESDHGATSKGRGLYPNAGWLAVRSVSGRGRQPRRAQSASMREVVRVSRMPAYTSSDRAIQAVTYQ